MKRLLRLARWAAGMMSMALLIGLSTLILRTNPSPWSAKELENLVAGLNEAAAIGVPHFFLLEDDVRSAHLALLNKVEQGRALSVEESVLYRRLMQTVLRNSQSFLSRFDRELTILPDYGLGIQNNCLGDGINGNHDHHDVSARLNFAAMITSMTALNNAHSPIARIRHANAVYKDLVDLISHLGIAAHVVSIPYVEPETPWPDEVLGSAFEDMLRNYKQAQFLPVNSKEYWQAVNTAEAAYVDLILAVQEKVAGKTSPLERRIAGRFLSPPDIGAAG